jgi:hypothetical protein
MLVGNQTRHVISTSEKTLNGRKKVMVVYKTYIGKHNDKPRYSSITKHELQ